MPNLTVLCKSTSQFIAREISSSLWHRPVSRHCPHSPLHCLSHPAEPRALSTDDKTKNRDLLRRLSPRDTGRSLESITSLVPDLTEDLLSSIDQPLEVRRCTKSNRDYLLCDYNRDGDSYRSPWSNEFDPPLEDGTVPSERVRKLEVAANEAFDVYRDLYYEGGIGSVYFWDLDDGLAGVVLLKKGTPLFQNLPEISSLLLMLVLGVTPGGKSSGAWDSIHVFEATDRARMSHYRLTSTVILHLANETDALGEMDLSGNMTRQIETDLPVESDASHIANVGRLVEDMELKMRNLLRMLYPASMILDCILLGDTRC